MLTGGFHGNITLVPFDPSWPDLADSPPIPAAPVARRLAEELAEAAASARHAGQDWLADSLDDRAEVFRLAGHRIRTEG